MACEGLSEEEECAKRIGEPPPTPRTIAPDGTEDCSAAFLEYPPENFQSSYVRSSTAATLEIADAAPPDRIVEASLQLTDRRKTCFTGWKRVLGYPLSREPVAALVEQHGGTVLNLDIPYPDLYVTLPAGHLRGAFCWPFIASITVETAYWDAVDPPWDRNSVGTSECPIVDGACPPHCTRETGAPFDEARQCWLPGGIVACDYRNLHSVTPGPSCSFNTSTGTYFSSSLSEPAFRGFRACSYDEAAQRYDAPRCED